jgi:hypothetical protein
MSRLIRVVLTKNSTGKTVETAKLLTALTGDVARLERTLNATISVEDPTLTDEEVKLLGKNFPHLLPARKVAPAPPPPLVRYEHVTDAVEVSEEEGLRDILDAAGVKHGRVKKIEKLREMVAELS